ncbi:1-acylglycerone phosphate reductase [Exophiala viscosa]|uniref:1-acylglycerone phosphate reductase n=1 Tax=Exophiala viscosa TaxID=2486360 RepID=UPI0021995F57|nr:1-acylglycerone phosphate reductase [Exophiala viscosa]
MSTVADQRRSVLITGCSQNGLGYAMAVAFHNAGLRVFATARDPTRMSGLKDLGIECLKLDVCDEESILECVEEIKRLTEGGLDCLANNAGGGYNMPVSDIAVDEAKALFDLNVWSYISVTKAFLPLLLQSATKGTSAKFSPSLIINNTSVSSVEPTPHNSVYHASKAAAAMFSTHMRIELAPFNVRVVDLKTGCVHSKFHANHQAGNASLPSTSIYQPVKDETESAMRGAFPHREDPEKWAKDVVRDIVRNWNNPPKEVWRGTGAWRTWFANSFFPVGWWDESWRRAVGLHLLKGRLHC